MAAAPTRTTRPATRRWAPRSSPSAATSSTRAAGPRTSAATSRRSPSQPSSWTAATSGATGELIELRNASADTRARLQIRPSKRPIACPNRQRRDDIQCDWGSLSSIIDYWGNWGEVLAPWAGPGHWHDMDMVSGSCGGGGGLSTSGVRPWPASGRTTPMCTPIRPRRSFSSATTASRPMRSGRKWPSGPSWRRRSSWVRGMRRVHMLLLAVWRTRACRCARSVAYASLPLCPVCSTHFPLT